MINIIAALSHENYGIGYEGGLLYKIKEDLQRFKTLTIGHPIIMGRKTWESLPFKPLPGRRNIVLTSQDLPDVEHYSSLQEAIEACQDQDIFIIGGGQVYKEALPLADRLYLTEIFDTPLKCDTYFPPYHGEFYCTHREYRITNSLRYEFADYERI